MSRAAPALEFGVDGLAPRQHFDVIGHIIVALLSVQIANADFDGLDGIKAVNVGNSQFVNAVDHAGMSRRHGIEPATPPRPASSSAKFAAHGVEHVRNLRVFSRQRPFADSRCIRLHYTHHTVHAVRRNARTSARTAGRRVRRGHKGICPVVNIQESALRPFEEDIVSASLRLVQENDRVGDKWPQIIPGLAVLGVNFFKGKRLRAKGFEDFVVLFDLEFKLLAKALGVNQIDHTQSSTGSLITVGRPDPPFCGADLVLAFEYLALGIQFAVVREDDVGGLAQKQIAADFDSEFAQPFYFLDQADRVHHDSIANHTNFLFAQYARGHQVKNVLLALDVDGMPGIVAALSADHYIRLLGQHIDDFAFAFVAPLGAHQNRIGHNFTRTPRIVNWGQGAQPLRADPKKPDVKLSILENVALVKTSPLVHMKGMIIPRIVPGLGLLLAFSLSAATLRLPSLTVGPNTYSNVVVLGANATDLYFTHDHGIGNVKLKYLSADLQKKFNYEAAAAAEAEHKQAEADAKYQSTVASDIAARMEKTRAAEAPPETFADPVSDKSLLGKAAPRLDVDKWVGEKPKLENKFVLITFLAPWSSACRQSVPELSALQKKFPEKLVIVGISTNSEEELMQTPGAKAEFACATDSKAKLSTAAGVTSVPFVLLVDTKGIVRYEGHPAALTEKKLQNLFSRPTD
jgi:cytochrome c biogenesis protein CcmG/thiol:disulfide interchange protein DsbE